MEENAANDTRSYVALVVYTTWVKCDPPNFAVCIQYVLVCVYHGFMIPRILYTGPGDSIYAPSSVSSTGCCMQYETIIGETWVIQIILV